MSADVWGEAQELTLFDGQESIHKTSVESGNDLECFDNDIETKKTYPLAAADANMNPMPMLSFLKPASCIQFSFVLFLYRL